MRIVVEYSGVPRTEILCADDRGIVDPGMVQVVDGFFMYIGSAGFIVEQHDGGCVLELRELGVDVNEICGPHEVVVAAAQFGE